LTESSTTPNKSGKAIIFALLLLILANVGMRVARITADSAYELPNGFRTVAPFRDEAAKAYEARAKTLTGSWTLHPMDQYEYWRKQSPVWVYSLWIWFEAFGVGYAQLRSVSVIFSAVTLLILYLGLRRSSGGLPALFAVVFLGFNYYFFLYSRLGLMEPMLLCWITISLFLAIKSEDDWRYLPASVFVWAVAFFTKQSAVVFLPSLLLAVFFYGGSPFRKSTWKKKAGAASWALMLAILAVIAVMFFWSDFYIRFFVNLRHFLQWDPTWHSAIYMRVQPERTVANVADAFGWNGIVRGWLMMMPVAFLLAVIELVLVIRDAVKRRGVPRHELIVIAWLITARALLALSPHDVVRFHLLQFIPTVWLAALLLRRMLSTGRRTIVVAAIFLVMASAVFHLQYVAGFLANPRYTIADGGKRVEELIGDREAALVGEWAPAICFGTNYDYYHVRNIFNNDRERLSAFKITHLLLIRGEDRAGEYFREALPEVFEKRQGITDFKIKDDRVELYKVPPAGD